MQLETWTNRNPVKLNAGKWQVLQLGKNNLMQLCSLGSDELEGSLAEKFLGVLVETKLAASSNVPLQQGDTNEAALGRASPAR